MKQFDFLVLGSGLAGLSFALKVAPHGRVAIITKKDRAESNTNYAQGGIASVTSKEDSFELHVRDTLQAGAGLCKEAAVRTIVEDGPARIAELIELGMHFTEREIPLSHGARELDLGREGGHSKRRILHAKDITGREIERALLAAVAEQPNIAVFENHLAINLITSQKLGAAGDNQCLGVYVLDKQTGQVETFAAPVTLLATGGCGKVYLYTTNPGHCHRRRGGHGLACGRRRRQHGVRAVPSHLPLPSQGQVLPDQRGGARGGRRAQEHRGRRVHGEGSTRSSRWRRATSSPAPLTAR